jgi:hypothetical protein
VSALTGLLKEPLAEELPYLTAGLPLQLPSLTVGLPPRVSNKRKYNQKENYEQTTYSFPFREWSRGRYRPLPGPRLQLSAPIQNRGANRHPFLQVALQVGNIAVMSGKLGAGSSETGWMYIMSTVIKTSQQKDLIMTASLEVGLYTRTLVRSKTGTPDTSSASAGVEVRLPDAK